VKGRRIPKLQNFKAACYNQNSGGDSGWPCPARKQENEKTPEDLVEDTGDGVVDPELSRTPVKLRAKTQRDKYSQRSQNR